MSLPTVPLLPPPTVIDNTHKHYDVATAVIILMIVATGFSVARFYLRWKSRTFGGDDWAMVPALVSYSGCASKSSCVLRWNSSCISAIAS
jgi:hypothetical protein